MASCLKHLSRVPVATGSPRTAGVRLARPRRHLSSSPPAAPFLHSNEARPRSVTVTFPDGATSSLCVAVLGLVRELRELGAARS